MKMAILGIGNVGQRLHPLLGPHATSALLCAHDPQPEKPGFPPLDVGPLAMVRHLEAVAHLNIQIAVTQKGGTNTAFIYRQSAA